MQTASYLAAPKSNEAPTQSVPGIFRRSREGRQRTWRTCDPYRRFRRQTTQFAQVFWRAAPLASVDRKFLKAAPDGGTCLHRRRDRSCCSQHSDLGSPACRPTARPDNCSHAQAAQIYGSHYHHGCSRGCDRSVLGYHLHIRSRRDACHVNRSAGRTRQQQRFVQDGTHHLHEIGALQSRLAASVPRGARPAMLAYPSGRSASGLPGPDCQVSTAAVLPRAGRDVLQERARVHI